MRITVRQRRFLEQYALDFNAAAAAVRAGYCGPNVNRLGRKQLARFATHPETRQLIRQEAAALGLGRRAIVTGLLKEALGIGPDTRSMARVRAWGALYPFATGGVPDDADDVEASHIGCSRCGPLVETEHGNTRIREDGCTPDGATIQFRGADGKLIDNAAPDESGAAGPGCETLTVRERRFIEEYQADFCATRAARRAGYSASYANVRSLALLGRLRDRPELATAEDVRRAALSAAINRTLSALLAEARGDRRATRSSARVSAWLKLARFLGMSAGPIKPRPPATREILFLDWKGNVMEPGGKNVDAEGDAA